MNLAVTKPILPSSHTPAVERSAEPEVSTKPSGHTSKKDSEDKPDFSTLLALLFPANVVTPTVPVDPTGGTSGAAQANGATAALGLPTVNALEAGNQNLIASTVAQNLPQVPAVATPKPAPFAGMMAKASDAVAPPTSTDAPIEVPGIVAVPPTEMKNPTPPPATPSRAAESQGRENAIQPKAIPDPKAPPAEKAANVEPEKSPIHESVLTPQLESTKNVPVQTAVAVSSVNYVKEPTSNAHDAERSPTTMSASIHREDALNPLVGQTEPSAKPAVSFVDQVHSVFQNNLDHLREQGRVELQMDLHPPDLGKMRLHLSMEDNQLNVRMDVQDERAKQALEQQMQPLRVHFAEMGVTLGQLDVRRDGTGNTPQQDQKSDGQAAATSAQQVRPETAKLRNAYERDLNSDARVDLLA